jgi:hypothetical protein
MLRSVWDPGSHTSYDEDILELRNTFRTSCERRNIRLTPLADELAQLCIRAWYLEQREGSREIDKDEATFNILTAVFNHPRFQNDSEINFDALLHVVVESGQEVLIALGFKGPPQDDPRGAAR